MGPGSTIDHLGKLRTLRDKMTDARFEEDLETLDDLEDKKASIEDKIRIGESTLRAYIRALVGSTKRI